MIRTFINRREEWNFLESKYSQQSFQFIVIYGRRRVGKTELVKKFISSKSALYFLADTRGTASNLERFKEKVAEFLQEPIVQLNTFDAVFKYLAGKMKNEKMVIAIDEFPYLLEKDDSIASVFQLSIDEYLKNTNIFLILLGSSVAMMEEGVLSKKSPLYGRRTGQYKISSLPFKEAALFLPAYSLTDALQTYAVLGGVPFYLVKVDDTKAVLQNIKGLILTKGEVLFEEIDFLLKEELRDPSTYKSILEALAKGCSKTIEIANKANLKVQDLDRYLKTLQSLGYVQRITPITEVSSSKKSIYRLGDHFFRFWFTFCFPFLSDLELGTTAKIEENIVSNFPAYIGHIFEEVCQQFLLKHKPIEFQKIGTWWGYYREQAQRREIEIDIVALNNETKKILLGECKWQEQVDAEKLLVELQHKASYVQWNNQDREEHYVIFAKSFQKKIKAEKVYLFDLKDMQRMII